MVRPAALGIALVATMMAGMPAAARSHERPHHRSYNGHRSGSFFGGLLIGALATALTKRTRQPDYFVPPDMRVPISMAPVVAPAVPPVAPVAAADLGPAEAIGRCRAAVGRHFEGDTNREGRVDRIGPVAAGPAGYTVSGDVRIEQADGSSRTSPFRCLIDRGRPGESLEIG